MDSSAKAVGTHGQPDGNRKPHVVVLGAGFAGLHAAKALARSSMKVTIVDRNNYHMFQPLLYQVATAALEAADIAAPIRQIVRGDHCSVLMSAAVSIDVAQKHVCLPDRHLEYDYLVVATGATDTYFGHTEWAKHAPGLKSLENAVEIRRRILQAFEAAELEADAQRRSEWLTFVVIGGGPTGVELAGALSDLARHTRPGDYDTSDPLTARVLLLEGSPRVLAAYPEELSKNAQRALERCGVEVRTGTRVSEVRDDAVFVGEERIPTRTVLWGAGVTASPVARSLGVDLDRGGRVIVTQQLTVPGHDEIFVIGDLAAFEQDGKVLPGLAPVAMAQGKHAAKNIQRALRSQPMQPFRYRDRGSFAVIGRGAAVGNAFGVRMTGYLAWFAWLAIHLMFLVGFRNRTAVMFNWIYLYLTRHSHAQLIISAPSTTNQAPSPRQEDAIKPQHASLPVQN